MFSTLLVQPLWMHVHPVMLLLEHSSQYLLFVEASFAPPAQCH